jgi:uncharacterized protein with NAD-binding domain and iron-sulfur cluster
VAVKIAIVGGGIGGLSAAHHLADAKFTDIHVYEETAEVGGKAKNQKTAGGYPGEHGFRFFPHFYRHVVDTMKHIPSGNGMAWDRLAESTEGGVAYDQQPILTVARPTRFDAPGKMIDTILTVLKRPGLNDPRDAMRFASVMLMFASSCDERRQNEYDGMTWEDFTGGTKAYGKAFYSIVIQATRNLAAMRAKLSSANTIATMCMQMIFEFDLVNHHKVDAVLDAPTDDAWLQPWRTHLTNKGVTFHVKDRLLGFDFQKPAVRAVQLSSGRVEAERFVCAVPLDRIVQVLTQDMKTFDPALARIAELAPNARGDMVGAQFFLKNDVPPLRGHIHLPKAPFGLTAVWQRQFWAEKPDYGVLSVIISDWEQKNGQGKAARDYTSRDELLEEIWRQLEEQLPPGTVNRNDVLEMHLDDNVTLNPFVNTTPLLTHPCGQLKLRPESKNRISNLYLAADYVRTYVDLATMEGANEAARRAVAAIMQDTNTPGPPPFLQRLSEGDWFHRAKQVDLILWKLNLPHPIKWRWKSVPLAILKKVDGAVDALIDAAVEALPKDEREQVRPLANAIRPLLEVLAQQPELDESNLDEEVLKQWAQALAHLPVPAIPLPDPIL